MKKYSKYLIIGLCILASFISLCFVPISASRLIPVIEEQAKKDLGVNVHIEKLILRVGPFLKVKAPLMHVMYEDGQKFAQLDNVKFYIPWSSFFKDSPAISSMQAKRLTVRIMSDDKYLQDFIGRLQQKDFNDNPNIKLKEYKFSYLNKDNNDTYTLEGQNFELDKISNYKNYKLKTNGSFSISNQKYISYDVVVNPNLELEQIPLKGSITDFINQIKELDFHSDVIADLKLYKNSGKNIQVSGFINIDNISVLDKSRKNPKSFIYLTLWGDKASVLSNIYTSENKKVYIEGMINNSKKPVLDLKVKTDEIAIDDLFQKVRIFTDFSRIKNIKSVSGTLNANFSLKGDLNKIKSNGFMKITNAGIKSNGFKIEKINSDIDFSNNTINIINAVGYVNNAPIIAKGSIDKNVNLELLMNKVELKYLCPASIGVKGGIASLIANITGTLDNIAHKENLLIENLKVENNKYNLAMSSFKIDTNKNNTAYVNNLICQTPETAQIKVPSLNVIIDSDNMKIPETNVYMPNSKLVVKSEILNFNNNDMSFLTTVNGFVNSKDFTRLKNVSTRYPIKISVNGSKLLQNINAQILFEKTDVLDEQTILNLASKVEKNTLKLEDLSLVSFSGKFSDDFKSNLKGTKKITVTGLIDDLKQPEMKNIRVFVPQQLNLQIFDTIAQLRGDLFINGKFEKPEIVGQLSIPNLFNQSTQLALTNCTLDFNKNNVVVNAPQVKLADSSMGLNALISTDFTNSINIKTINVKSKYLNTDTILMYKDSPITKLYPMSIQDGKFYSEKILANVYGAPVYLSAFTSDFKLNNDLISLKNISSEIFNGKLSGNMDYNLRDEHFTTKIMSRNVSAEPIFSIISTRKDNINGVMDFDANITGELTSKQSLNGNIKFIVNNGRMSTLGKLEHLLYAQNVVADNMLRTSLSVVTKAITLKDTGLFKYLRGDIDLENGIANIKMLQSQGPLMALYIKGQYNPMNDYAKMVVLGRLSDEVVSGLGAFGDFSFNKLMVMLTGDEQKHNILPEDFDKLPQLPMKNTKEFRSIINGNIDKPSSVLSFNWISYSQKSLKQKDVPTGNVKIPDFVESLPY